MDNQSCPQHGLFASVPEKGSWAETGRERSCCIVVTLIFILLFETLKPRKQTDPKLADVGWVFSFCFIPSQESCSWKGNIMIHVLKNFCESHYLHEAM
ncbi:hypothetical protein FRX31_026126 [Thalictrum thalictroides]|uniref:Uncharacterized protein n=1 Tax=Thalictrum thalictroides TaxID=46969 RepID=A0A7J6VGP7_THATH|nr:hypothetical protein FRX31_026126 [Thalictrum thalictroides]